MRWSWITDSRIEVKNQELPPIIGPAYEDNMAWDTASDVLQVAVRRLVGFCDRGIISWEEMVIEN
jgi:hypothetical protein